MLIIRILKIQVKKPDKMPGWLNLQIFKLTYSNINIIQ